MTIRKDVIPAPIFTGMGSSTNPNALKHTGLAILGFVSYRIQSRIPRFPFKEEENPCVPLSSKREETLVFLPLQGGGQEGDGVRCEKQKREGLGTSF